MGKISRLIDFEGSESSVKKIKELLPMNAAILALFRSSSHTPHSSRRKKRNQIKLDVREKILLTNIADVVFSNIHILDIRDDEKNSEQYAFDYAITIKPGKSSRCFFFSVCRCAFHLYAQIDR